MKTLHWYHYPLNCETQSKIKERLFQFLWTKKKATAFLIQIKESKKHLFQLTKPPFYLFLAFHNFLSTLSTAFSGSLFLSASDAHSSAQGAPQYVQSFVQGSV